jgi:hypothetical protein
MVLYYLLKLRTHWQPATMRFLPTLLTNYWQHLLLIYSLL